MHVKYENEEGEFETYKFNGLNLDTKIKLLREKVAKKIKIDVPDTVLLYNHKRLRDRRTLESYGIGDGTTINATTRSGLLGIGKEILI